MSSIAKGIGGLFKGKKTKTRVIDYSPFPELRAPVSSTLQDFMRTGMPYGGPFVAEWTPEEQEYLDELIAAGREAPPLETAGRDVLLSTLRGEYLSPESNPFLSRYYEAAARPVVRHYQDVAMPELRSQFTRGGQFVQPGASSPFASVLERAGTRFREDLSDLAARIYGPAYEAERGRMMGALGPALEYAAEPMRRLQAGYHFAGERGRREQEEIDKMIAAYEAATGRQLSAAEIGGMLSRGQPIVHTEPGRPSVFSELLSTAGRVAPFLPYMFR